MRVVRLAPFGVFRSNATPLTQNDEVELFDRAWNSGLKKALEDAINRDDSIEPKVVIDRMMSSGMSPSAKYVDTSGQSQLYECKFSALCVAQVKTRACVRAIDQLWFFTYGSRQPKLFCFEFATEEEKRKFKAFAEKRGHDAQSFARDAVVGAMKEQLAALQREVDSLGAEVTRLRATAESSSTAYFKACLAEFETRLTGNFNESKGPESWQKWIAANSWIFGVRYGDPLTQFRIGLSSTPDFLFPTLDGNFIDILEIKLPSADVLRADGSHPGSIYWASDVTTAIGQVVNYLHEIDANQSMLAQNFRDKELNLRIARPRAFILIGRSKGWSDVQRSAFRRLNHSLHCIEVITYDELLERARQIASLHAR